jgi:hypothetical protein
MKRRLALGGLLICVVILVSKLFAHPTSNVLVYSPPDTTTLTDAHSGQIITNVGATGTRTFNLPHAAAGLHFLFALSAAQTIKVNPQDFDLFIGTGLTISAGQSLLSDSNVGTLVEIVAIDSTNWLQIRKAGAWTNGG